MNFHFINVQEKERNSIELTIRLIRVQFELKEEKKSNYGIGER
jgi:hypothetical protein